LKILAIIPARGGSKGIPHKNIKLLLNKPLIGWTIETALSCSFISETIVTTESQKIAEIAKTHGANVPFMRPNELSQDSTPGIEPVLHAIEQLPQYDWVLLLQPTSPLRTVEDICGIIDLVVTKNGCSAVSVADAVNHPFWTYSFDGLKLKPFFRSDNSYQRQLLPQAYSLNGALYFASSKFLIENRTFITSETLGYVMPKTRSIDIDDADDWQLAEYFLRSKNKF
jgi:CMP-N,N'-diacetyllegionaminic acid synthase